MDLENNNNNNNINNINNNMNNANKIDKKPLNANNSVAANSVKPIEKAQATNNPVANVKNNNINNNGPVNVNNTKKYSKKPLPPRDRSFMKDPSLSVSLRPTSKGFVAKNNLDFIKKHPNEMISWFKETYDFQNGADVKTALADALDAENYFFTVASKRENLDARQEASMKDSYAAREILKKMDSLGLFDQMAAEQAPNQVMKPSYDNSKKENDEDVVNKGASDVLVDSSRISRLYDISNSYNDFVNRVKKLGYDEAKAKEFWDELDKW